MQVRNLASRCATAIAEAYVDCAEFGGWSKYYLRRPEEVGVWGTANAIEALTIARQLDLSMRQSSDEIDAMIQRGISFLAGQQISAGLASGAWSITQLRSAPFVDSTAIVIRALAKANFSESYGCIREGVRWLVQCRLSSGGWSYLERDREDSLRPKTCATAYATLALSLASELDIFDRNERIQIAEAIRQGVAILKSGINSDLSDPGRGGWGRAIDERRPNPAYTLVALITLQHVQQTDEIHSYASSILQLLKATERRSSSAEFDQAPWAPVRDVWTPALPLSERFLVFFTTAFLVTGLSTLGFRMGNPLARRGMTWLVQSDRGGKYYDYQNLPRLFSGLDTIQACKAYISALSGGQIRSNRLKVTRQRDRVLISYKKLDCSDFAGWLARRLRDEGVEPWFDEWNILPGDSLSAKLEQAFQETNACLILLTPAYMDSRWSTREMRTAIYRSLSGNYRVIPLIVSHCEIPNLLRDLKRVSFEDCSPEESENRFQLLMAGLRQS
jgi:hypothetical protein